MPMLDTIHKHERDIEKDRDNPQNRQCDDQNKGPLGIRRCPAMPSHPSPWFLLKINHMHPQIILP